jgi:hypothetical protein
MEQVKEAIKFLAEKLNENLTADEALKYSQAALNLANCEAVTKNSKLGNQ